MPRQNPNILPIPELQKDINVSIVDPTVEIYSTTHHQVLGYGYQRQRTRAFFSLSSLIGLPPLGICLPFEAAVPPLGRKGLSCLQIVCLQAGCIGPPIIAKTRQKLPHSSAPRIPSYALFHLAAFKGQRALSRPRYTESSRAVWKISSSSVSR